jgi:beta-phosphoglucomutase-like phosphatase (HAD superfamily)
LEAYKEVVGLSRREVASALVERSDLEEKAQARMDEFGVGAPWQALVQVRLAYYEDMISDPEIPRDNQWPHNLALLQMARETGCKTALATTSGLARTRQVLQALGLGDAFEFVAARDDVEREKPHPEIYQLVCQELQIPAEQSLVIKDSPSGVEAALAAGLHCIAVTTPFTRQKLRDQNLLEERWIVDDPALLPDVVQRVFEQNE